MRHYPTLILLVALCSPLSAQEKAQPAPKAPAAPPVVKVEGPTYANVGDIVHLHWSMDGIDYCEVEVFPAQYSDGRTTHEFVGKSQHVSGVQIGSRPGVYVVEIAASNASGIHRQRYTVSVGTDPTPSPTPPGPVPGPIVPPKPPAPAPSPNPPPPLPGLAGEVAAMVSLVPGATGAALLSLADKAEAIDAQIAAGALKTTGPVLYTGERAIMAALAEALNQVATANGGTSLWMPFGDAYKARLKAMFSGGALKTNDDFRSVLKATFNGLRHAAAAKGGG